MAGGGTQGSVSGLALSPEKGGGSDVYMYMYVL